VAGRTVRFGFAGKGLWTTLDVLRIGPAQKSVVPIPPVLRAEVKFFGRHKGGAIRDGVMLSLAPRADVGPRYGCDCEEVIELFDAYENLIRPPFSASAGLMM